MAIIDITKYVITKTNRLFEIKQWLNDNVGEMYTRNHLISMQGTGWYISNQYRRNPKEARDGASVVELSLHIESDVHAVMFKLLWP